METCTPIIRTLRHLIPPKRKSLFIARTIPETRPSRTILEILTWRKTYAMEQVASLRVEILVNSDWEIRGRRFRVKLQRCSRGSFLSLVSSSACRQQRVQGENCNRVNQLRRVIGRPQSATMPLALMLARRWSRVMASCRSTATNRWNVPACTRTCTRKVMHEGMAQHYREGRVEAGWKRESKADRQEVASTGTGLTERGSTGFGCSVDALRLAGHVSTDSAYREMQLSWWIGRTRITGHPWRPTAIPDYCRYSLSTFRYFYVSFFQRISRLKNVRDIGSAICLRSMVTGCF